MYRPTALDDLWVVGHAVYDFVTNSHTHNNAGVRQFRLALVQLAIGAKKSANLQRASKNVREAANNGAEVVVLPVSTCQRKRMEIVLFGYYGGGEVE